MTSGSDNLTTSTNELVSDAHRNIGQLEEGEVLEAQQLADGTRALERMVKAFQAAGLHIWKYEEFVLFLVKDQQSYSLGAATSENWVKTSDLTTTTTNTDEAISSTSIGVTSISGMSSGDKIGIVVDDNTIHWDVINGAPTGTTVVLTTGLDVAATSGNKVYVYTSAGVKPLGITQVRTQIDTNSETDHHLLSRDGYFGLANKAATGSPVQSYYQPRLTDGLQYVWPTVQDERQFLNVTAQIQIEDMDGGGNAPDFPSEWYDCLVWNLSKRLMPMYGVIDPATIQLVMGMAVETYDAAEEFDVEYTSLVLMPDNEAM